jgi:hypothetical protein
MKSFFKFLVLALASVSFAEVEQIEDAPPYDRSVNIVPKEIEDWIARGKDNASRKDTLITLKTDLLGRHLSSGTVELLKKSRKASVNEQKRLVVISDMHISEHEPVNDLYERYEIDATGLSKYYVNGQEFSEKDYLNYAKKSWEKLNNNRKIGKRNLRIPGEIKSNAVNWTAWMTASELSELLDKNKELAVRDYVEPQSEASRPTILSLTQLSTHAFPNNYKGRNIGIYYSEAGCILTGGGVDMTKFSQMNACNSASSSDNAHATAVARVLQMASPEAKIYGYGYSQPYPNNPFSNSPPIEIGTQSWNDDASDIYNSSDFDMDHYIYQNRIIEFKSAGNQGKGTGNVTSPGKALNVITVGAVEPETGKYPCYSSWRNPDTRNNKPEIAAYTNIDFSDNSVLTNIFQAGTDLCGTYSPAGNFNGTSAAAPLLAGFTANLLEQHPFFKRRPSLLKALYIAGSTVPINEPANAPYDSDNLKKVALIPYSSVGWNIRSMYFEVGNSSFFDSTRNFRFMESVRANKRYRIAIAWLTPANYILQRKRPSQDMQLYVYQNGRLINWSTSYYNTFELVDFVAASNDPITIRILRTVNAIGQGDNIILGYTLWEEN